MVAERTPKTNALGISTMLSGTMRNAATRLTHSSKNVRISRRANAAHANQNLGSKCSRWLPKPGFTVSVCPSGYVVVMIFAVSRRTPNGCVTSSTR